jgi:3-methyladenine DNA glycosylase AlkD
VSRSVADAAARARRDLTRLARPVGEFNPSRYFRTTAPLQFLNVRTPIVRSLARQIAREFREAWTIHDATAFTDLMIREPHLESKGAGIEALGCRRRELRPGALRVFKAWLEADLCANWATTDTLCGTLISPLLIAYPALVRPVTHWSRHRNLWVRRAAAVSLVRLAARGLSLDEAYDVVTALREDGEDLIHKAAGWLLRECGRTDPVRLERYLRTNGASMPRTTIRYAIERFPDAKRRTLLRVTHPAR